MPNCFPDYAFYPGGPWPHPTRTAEGHSFGHRELPAPEPIDPAHWEASEAYLWGYSLFDAGYYWEAHETWEGLWHVHHRCGPIADLLKALIKLAAAGVKVREGQPEGVRRHSLRAALLIEMVRQEVGPSLLGVNLDSLAAIGRETALNPPSDTGDRDARVRRVFLFQLMPTAP